MPEGHVIHRFADELNRAFAGRVVAVASPQGRFAREAGEVDGRVLRGADAYGKHLFIGFDGDGARIVHIHLGLIGRLDFDPPIGVRRLGMAEPADGAGRPGSGRRSGPGRTGSGRTRSDQRSGPGDSTVRLRVSDARTAVTLRGPQTCELLTQAEVDDIVAGLGPDPLRADADPDQGWQRVRRSSRPVAALLMDQRVAAGVGNIYRAEVLFRNGLDPDMPGRELGTADWDAVWADLVALMAQGVVRGRIDTVRPEHEPAAMGREPRVDPHGGEVYVYRREGQPCLVCGTPIRARAVEGRRLFWCPSCQR